MTATATDLIAALAFTPEPVSHGRTMYRCNVRNVLHDSERAGRDYYSRHPRMLRNAQTLLGNEAEAPGGLAALDRVLAEGWRLNYVGWDAQHRLRIQLWHIDSRWGTVVGVNFDRGGELAAPDWAPW